MAAFAYKFVGDGPKLFRGREIKPGDVVEAEEELIHGHFEPTSPAAKKAAAAREAAEKVVPESPAAAAAEKEA